LFSPRSKPCARLERWILRLQSFDYEIVHKPGKQNIADPISRLSITDSAEVFDQDTEDYIYHIVEVTKPKEMSVESIRKYSLQDDILGKLRTALQTKKFDKETLCFKPFELEITELQGILLRGTRLIPPEELKPLLLQKAHDGHLGMSKMKRRLRASVWWPNMDSEIEKYVKDCRSCTIIGSLNPPIPLKTRELPTSAWEHLAADFLGPLGPASEFVLVVIDYYSRFIEVEFMKQATSKKTIRFIRAIIGRHGYPKSLTTDNGPQFRAEEFIQFCKEMDIKLNLTTPYWPQANGEDKIVV
jgi:hypothetical protein